MKYTVEYEIKISGFAEVEAPGEDEAADMVDAEFGRNPERFVREAIDQGALSELSIDGITPIEEDEDDIEEEEDEQI